MKRLFAAALLGLAAAAICAADETAEIYQMLYAQAQGLQQKNAAAVQLVGLGDKTTAPILASALQELLLQQQSYSSGLDQDLYGSTVRIVAQALGDYKYAPAAPFLWQAAQSVPDSLARAEAIISLGKLRALDYVERIALMLRDLNLQPAADRDKGEKLAYGCIVALGKFKDPRGFSPVFFAADAWYSQRVRQQASQALPDISDDPTDPIKAILAVESPERRLRALQAEIASKASLGRKVETAILALGIGHSKLPLDKNEAKVFGDLRKLALRSLAAYKASGPDPVELCAASYTDGADDEERLLALAALGANGSDSAAAALRDIILKLNEDQKMGVTDETRNRMAKAAIDNAGLARNKALRPALLAVTINNTWSGGVILAAQAALKALQ
jgi:HEAT repeat protein